MLVPDLSKLSIVQVNHFLSFDIWYHRSVSTGIILVVVNAMEVEVTPTLEEEILKGQLEDDKLKEIAQNVVLGKAPGFRIDDNGVLWFGKRICVPRLFAI